MTTQSADDANLNGDAAGDRVIINTNGTPGTSSDVTALKNSSGGTVAYLANNPNAQFIRAQKGAFANSGRNIVAGRGINNWDFNVAKVLAIIERYRLQVRTDIFSVSTHSKNPPATATNINATNPCHGTNYLTPVNTQVGPTDDVSTTH